jgi:cytoskeleton protein RodZ
MTLEAIGQKLKSARETQGLSLRQIYERTKIPINHLQAIDTGQPDDLPEPVYVAGFIKRYAECIGLDGQVLADEYKRVDGNGNGKAKLSQPGPVYVTHDYLKHAKIDNRPPVYKLLPFYLVAIIGLLWVLYWYSSNHQAAQTDSGGTLKESLQSQLPPTGATAADGTSTGINGATGSPNAAQAPDNGKNGVVLTANQRVWITVKRDGSGETIYTGFMENGDRRNFEDPKGIRVTAGNGGSVSVEIKGKIEPFGAAGKRTERVFSTQGAVASAAGQSSPSTGSSPTGSSSTSSGSTTGSATDSTATATASPTTTTKPKKTTKPASTASRRWQSDDGETRSIPGNDGTRSIDVPYRYSEGRLDAN